MTTPLTLKAFGEALEQFGTNPSRIVAPAIEYCEQGFTGRSAILAPAIHRGSHQAYAGHYRQCGFGKNLLETRRLPA